MKLSEAIGYELKTQRLIHRKKLQDVADHLNVGRNTVFYWESGRNDISLDKLAEYCDYLGLDWIELLERVRQCGNYEKKST